jgi:protein TonB
MDFRKSLAISTIFHVLVIFLVPGIWFSLEKPSWVEVSVITFPDMKQRMPEWTSGRKVIPQPSAEAPDIQKSNLPAARSPIGIPVESASLELPDFVPKQDYFPVMEEFEKVIPGREESRGLMEGEGEEKVMTITGPVSRRKLIRKVYPKYPSWAEEKGVEGEVDLKFWVSPEGMVTSVELIRTSGYPDLDSKAMEAIKKYLFSPLGKEEDQEEQWGTITIKYTLK